MKKINAVIVGIILMVSLGLILNVLFSDKASRGMSEQRDFDVSREEGAPNDSKRETQHQDTEELKEETDTDSDDTDQVADKASQEDDQETENSDSLDSESENQETEDSSESLETSKENQESNQINQSDNSDKANGQDGQDQSDQGQAENSNQSSQPSPNRPNQSRTETPPKSSQEKQESQESQDKQSNENQEADQVSQEPQAKLVTITIDARQDGGNQYFGETQYQVGDTALDILLRFTQDRGISVTLAEDASNGDVFDIDGHQADESYGVWVLYINGQRSVHQAGANKIAPGSNLRYHYQKQ